jgi:hypothetical protein
MWSSVLVKAIKSVATRRCVAGLFVSRSFMFLLRKSIPQNHNLQTAVVRGVMLVRSQNEN